MAVLELFLVVIVPVLSLPVEPVVDELAVKLKQYKTFAVKSELPKVTVLPETALAFVEIPGQAVAPAGRLEVSVVQLEVLAEIVKSVGKVTSTEFSIPAPGEEA